MVIMYILFALLLVISIFLVAMMFGYSSKSETHINEIKDYNQINIYVQRGIHDNVHKVGNEVLEVREDITEVKKDIALLEKIVNDCMVDNE